MIRVLLIDGQEMFHPAIKSILSSSDSIELIGAFTCISHEWDSINKAEALDLILFTPSSLNINWSNCVEKLASQFPQARLFAILQSVDEAKSPQIRNQNLAGLIVKADSPEKLVEAITTVSKGQRWISKALIPHLFTETTSEIVFSSRELELLHLLVQGKTDKEIAKSMHISERTVRNHLVSIQKKLGSYSRVETAVQAVKRGLVSDNPSHS